MTENKTRTRRTRTSKRPSGRTRTGRTRTNDVYDESSIEVLEGLEGCRRKPTMYLGERGDTMVYNALKEFVDNSIDEHYGERNDTVQIFIDNENSTYIVADCAEGIPVGKNKQTGLSTLEVIFTKLHAGGKFGDKSYKTSAGTHGVGAAAANAISSTLDVWTQRDSVWYHQLFDKGVAVGSLKKAKPPRDVLSKLKTTKNLGTVLKFIPDQDVVSIDANTRKKNKKKAVVDAKRILSWMKSVTNLNSGLKVYVRVETVKGTRDFFFHNKKGLAHYVKESMIEGNGLKPIGRTCLEYYSDTMSLALQWTDHPDIDLFKTFVNSSPTHEHGSHEKGFIDALTKAIAPHKTKKDKFKLRDIVNGLVGVMNLRMSEAEFQGQLKGKLVSNVSKQVEEELLPVLEDYFSKNKTLPKQLIKRAVSILKGRDQLKTLMKSVGEVKKSTRGLKLPNVLFEATKATGDAVETFIVEGASAGGTAKEARFHEYQQVLKLTGKIRNALRTPLPALLASPAIQNILVALGIDTRTLDTDKDFSKMKFDTSKLKTGKIFLLSDADPDGDHINVLILALIYRILPDLIREGKVFVVDAPLFMAFYKNVRYFGPSHEACYATMPKGAPKDIITRAKGWGEIDADMLRYIAFDPKHRTVIKITMPTDVDALEYFNGIVGENVALRRELLGIK